MKKLAFIAISGLLALASCSTTKSYAINPKSGTETQGRIIFTQKGKNVEMELNAYKLTAGIHAVHIHEKGDCSASDGSSAGGHWNPTGEDHGKWTNTHHHNGDIGNLIAGEDGVGRLVFKTDKWCLGCSDSNRNIIGKSIIIHAKADDFTTQPTGNAGARVGCVEIK